MDEKVFERLLPEEIELRVADLTRIFEKVRPLAPNELCAWLVAQALDRTIEREHWAKVREEEEQGPVTEKQIRLLQQLGIYQLADLSQHQAAHLIRGMAARLSSDP